MSTIEPECNNKGREKRIITEKPEGACGSCVTIASVFAGDGVAAGCAGAGVGEEAVAPPRPPPKRSRRFLRNSSSRSASICPTVRSGSWNCPAPPKQQEAIQQRDVTVDAEKLYYSLSYSCSVVFVLSLIN